MRHKNTAFFITISVIFSILLDSCSSEIKEPVPDVSKIKVETEINRFDKELFSIDTNQFAIGFEKLQNRYPLFTDVFFKNVMGAYDPRVAPEGPQNYMRGFISAPVVQRLYDTCQIVFKNFKPIEDQFTQSFKYIKYYFPNRRLPSITTFISEYSFAVFIYGKGDLGVGLDFFLGSNYPYASINYENPNFSNYLTRTYNKEHLVSKTLMALIDDWVGQAPSRDRLIDHMIHNGKKLFFLRKILPQTPDSVIYEYSKKQVDWLKKNESNMWAFFTSENLLYNEDYQKIRKYVEYSPNAPGMPVEAPGKTANWLGERIVTEFMKKNPGMSFENLLKQTDAQKILETSKYRPRRN